MTDNRLRLSEISKTFQEGRPNQYTALRDINLDIDLRSFVVFKGPSGSGKTTLLSLIGCMSRPTTGRVYVRDTEVTGLPEKFLSRIRRRHFGFVFQDFRLLPSLNVVENVMLPAWPVKWPGKDIRRRATLLLEQLNMDSRSRQHPKDLSAGEKQRVAFARALMNDPDFLIADEPTAHLDSDLSLEILEIIHGLRRDGKGVLVASHDPLMTGTPGIDHLFALRDGRITGEA